MPNDCLNVIECLRHDDPATLQRLVEGLQRDPPVFLAAFVPCPDHSHPVQHWGTKWDVYDVVLDAVTETTVQMSFHTAWRPPLEAYAALKAQGFTIDAMFMESGSDFCGYWRDGDTVTFDNVSRDLDHVPEDFHFYFVDDHREEEEEEEVEEVEED
jgi:hypothetical protein